MEKETVADLQARVKALQELNDLLLQQARESRKLLGVLGVEKGESSIDGWIV